VALFFLVVSFFGWGGTSRADIIDFEAGYSRLDPVSLVNTATNSVTIETLGDASAPTFIAQVGTKPKDAFENVVNGQILGDTPEGGNPGSYFLTDGAGNVANYLFSLKNPVGEFSIDLYDYVGDGGAAVTDYAQLTAYADVARTSVVATDTYVVPKPRPLDGLAVTLTVSAPAIAAVTLDFSTLDRGTGVDNIQFVTVPEPSAMVLAALSIVTLLIGVQRRRR
jgi:hypothetical protein